jgi:hypothetical protein
LVITFLKVPSEQRKSHVDWVKNLSSKQEKHSVSEEPKQVSQLEWHGLHSSEVESLKKPFKGHY